MKTVIFVCIAVIAMGIEIKIGEKNDYLPAYERSACYSTTRGIYATAYPWQKSSLLYASKFQISEIGSFEDIESIDSSIFAHPIAYVWLAGFYKYQIHDDPFARWAYRYKEFATLNPHYTPNGNDFYLDMCDERVQNQRAGYLLQKCRELGLSGLFFDWANDEFLYEKGFEPILKNFRSRHPGIPYSVCIENFLAKLKREGLLIVTNQAYRNPDILKQVDYDMSESYLLELLDNNTTKYQDLAEVMEWFERLKRLKERYAPFGFKNFIYMNYTAPPKPKEELLYGYVLAKMGGFIPYTEVPSDRDLERTSLYFLDLGEPVEKMQEFDGGWMRVFERGVLLLFWPLKKERYIHLSQMPKGLLFDYDEGVWHEVIKDLTIRVRPNYNQADHAYHLKAKVLIYAK